MNLKWDQIRLLWREFDPIGVYGEESDWPEDEYDSYVTETYQLLEDKASERVLLEYLTHACHHEMGVKIPKDDLKKFASKFFT